MTFKAILFDMIGTTVKEQDPMFINNCFIKAFGEHKIDISRELVLTHRGKDKNQAVSEILATLDYPDQFRDPIMQRFRRNIEKGIHNFSAADRARDVFGFLKAKGVKIGIGSGLPRETFDMVFRHLQWDAIPFDYIGITEEVGRGRPYPDMILDMMKKLRLSARELLKVGDTVADIQEGKNAGVKTVVVLAGTQPEELLRKEKPDYVVRRLDELREIVRG
jgi:HAD superfamily hydrolase (TIGR01549 family)